MEWLDTWVKGVIVILVVLFLAWAFSALGLLAAIVAVFFGNFTLEGLFGGGLVFLVALIILLPLAVGVVLERLFGKGGGEEHGQS